MLSIKGINKKYTTGALTQIALDDVSLNLRDSEFVAVLGPSGSGKTTLLNIIGGLDRYDSGDLIINGITTKKYKDRDWDSYRNHSVGFVFQTYNLIPHQSILTNVELALTISGISKVERRKRAAEVLEQVGLGDQLHKKPNQMSGGQMQRVAIARALVNNPDILLADEPTGALDSKTSIQVMELLKEVAKDRLVIMVTHNPELANTYATRIIKLSDGQIVDDSNPPKQGKETEAVHKNLGRARMSFLTAFSLSLNNLLAKKGRTILTAFAGSIGIIGIALILSLSSGMQAYINGLQEDTLSTYPISITSDTMDITVMMSALMEADQELNHTKKESKEEEEKIYSQNIMTDVMTSISEQVNKNDLKQFKKYLDGKNGKKIEEFTNSIQYGYDLDLQIYKPETDDGIIKVNPTDIFSTMMGGNGGGSSFSPSPMGSDIWTEMIGNDKLLQKQYDVIAGQWPKEFNEVVLVVDDENQIADAVLYSLGLLDQKDLDKMMEKIGKGEKIKKPKEVSYSYDDLLGMSFKAVLNSDVYEKQGDKWTDKSKSEAFMKPLIKDGLDIKIVGILRPNEEIQSTAISGSIAYKESLTRYVIDKINESEIVKEQKATPETDIFTDMPFDMEKYTENLTMADVREYTATLPPEQQAQMQAMSATMSEEEILSLFSDMMRDNAEDQASYEGNLAKLGVVAVDNPSSINIYPKDYAAKDEIAAFIKDYNKKQKKAGHEEYEITYTDLMEVLMSSVTSMMNIVTYVLIAFVSISLIVSSIMIAIITYVSVLERTKEIGILRSIGASKGDISKLFNMETIIEGFVAGALGIIVTILLNIPINLLIKQLADLSGISALPPVGAVSLIALSVFLTLIAGLIPARLAAKKDPVVALRTE